MTVEELMDEADKLIRQINSEFTDDMADTQRLQLEKSAQGLKEIKAEVQDRIDKKHISATGGLADGMHEAILDIVKAFQAFDKDVF